MITQGNKENIYIMICGVLMFVFSYIEDNQLGKGKKCYIILEKKKKKVSSVLFLYVIFCVFIITY